MRKKRNPFVNALNRLQEKFNFYFRTKGDFKHGRVGNPGRNIGRGVGGGGRGGGGTPLSDRVDSSVCCQPQCTELHSQLLYLLISIDLNALMRYSMKSNKMQASKWVSQKKPRTYRKQKKFANLYILYIESKNTFLQTTKT